MEDLELCVQRVIQSSPRCRVGGCRLYYLAVTHNTIPSAKLYIITSSGRSKSVRNSHVMQMAPNYWVRNLGFRVGLTTGPQLIALQPFCLRVQYFPSYIPLQQLTLDIVASESSLKLYRYCLCRPPQRHNRSAGHLENAGDSTNMHLTLCALLSIPNHHSGGNIEQSTAMDDSTLDCLNFCNSNTPKAGLLNYSAL